MSEIIWQFLIQLLNLIIPFITIRYSFDLIRHFLFEV